MVRACTSASIRSRRRARLAADLGRPRRLPARRSAGTTDTLPSLVARPVDGTGPTIVAAHPVAPVPGEMAAWRRGLQWLADRCAGTNVILAGDLNSTLDHYTGLGTDGGDLGRCHDAARATGNAAVGTWPTAFPPLLGAPIDHVMATPDWEVVGFRVVGLAGRRRQRPPAGGGAAAPCVAENDGMGNENRSTTPQSTTFKDFISGGWAERPEPRPTPRAQAPYAADRRARISALHPGERLVIPAGPAKARANDTDYPYRAHSAFSYLTGWGSDAVPGSVLVLEPTGDGHDATLYLLPTAGRDSEEFYANAAIGEFWTGPRPSLAHVAADLGARDPPPRRVRRRARRRPTASTRIVREADRDLTDQLDGRRLLAAEDAARPSTRTVDADFFRDLSEMRLVKDEYEIREMRLAVDATKQGFDDVIADLPQIVAAPARRAPRRGHVLPPRPRRGQRGRLRHDRGERPARLHPALDPQRRPGRAGRPDPARRRHRARLALHGRHHPHPADLGHLHRRAAPGLRGGARGGGCGARDREAGHPVPRGARRRDAGHRAQDRRVGAAAGHAPRSRSTRISSTTAGTWCTAPATTSASTCTTARRPVASCTSTARCSRAWCSRSSRASTSSPTT